MNGCMRFSGFPAALLLSLSTCLSATAAMPVSSPAATVNVFIGTSGTRVGGPIDTFPGASLPFGMLQWSPDTSSQPAGGGYDYQDRRITGFSLTHLSGPGCSVFGDIGILPTTGPVAHPATASQPFSHADEQAAPGWYAVTLGHPGIRSELTVTERTGLGRFRFPTGGPANLLFKVSSDQAGVTAADFKVTGNDQVSGSASSGRFCGKPDRFTVYFVAQFSRPFKTFGTWQRSRVMPGTRNVDGAGSGGWVSFDATHARSVEVKVAVSYVSVADALANLKAENPDWNLEAMHRRATAAWNRVLKRITVTGGTRQQRETFYTALYHVFLAPTIYSDVNGRYRGFDGKVHRAAAGHVEYANYSGWDIYRSDVPLIALLAPHEVSDMMQSLVDEARQGGWLPKWALANGYTGVMGGDAADTIIAGAWAFGARDFDTHAALQAMLKGATDTHSPPGQGWYVERPGLKQYLDEGYVGNHLLTSVAPVPNGASETLEYASDDFSIAQFAAELGDRKAHAEFLRHSMNWANLFDTDTGLIAARNGEGAFVNTPITGSGQSGFQEGNAAQYTWMVPQDLADLIRGMGGRAAARQRLDRFFTKLNAGQSESYAWLGNEPSFGAPWVYLSAGAPWRTQAIVRKAVTTLYGPTPDGIPGNDDLGAMSSWYLWSAMGLYPQNPAVRFLDIGSPLFPHIVVHAPGGPTIDIHAPQAAANKPYVHALRVDGTLSQHSWIDLPMTGNVRLDFTLGSNPDLHWGTAVQDAPPSYRAAPVHFPPATTAVLHVASSQYALNAGAAGRVSFKLDSGKRSNKLHWWADAPQGVQLQPVSGSISLDAQQTLPVHLKVSLSSKLAAGYYDVPVHARAPNGAVVPATDLIVRVIRSGQRPELLYVENFVDDTVTPVDANTHAVGPAIKVGHHPAEAVLSPDGKRVYVSTPGSDSVAVIDTATQKVAATISHIGPAPDSLAVSHDGRTLWVADYASNRIQVIDTRTFKVGKPIVVGRHPGGLTLSPDGKSLYVANRGVDSISVVDTRSGKVRREINVGTAPSGIAVLPDGKRIYVANRDSNSVTPIDVQTGKVLPAIPVGLAPIQLAVSPNGKLIYVVNSVGNSLTPIDVATDRAGKPIEVGARPFAAAFSRNGKTVFVVDGALGECVPVTVATGTIGKPIPVGNLPVAISAL